MKEITCSSKFGNILQKTKLKISNTSTNRNGQKFKYKPKVGLEQKFCDNSINSNESDASVNNAVEV